MSELDSVRAMESELDSVPAMELESELGSVQAMESESVSALAGRLHRRRDQSCRFVRPQDSFEGTQA